MTELEKIQADLDKKYEGGYIVFPKNIYKKEGKHLLNELKALNLSKTDSERNMHIYRIAASRAILLRTGILTEEEVSAFCKKANVKLTDDEKLFERAFVACENYFLSSSVSPCVLLEKLKAELWEE